MNKKTGRLIFTMVIIVISGLLFAGFYYGNINNAEDPRILEAKKKYKQYDILASEKKYDEILEVLDAMSNIYTQFDDYKNSFEMGVVYNNKAALFLTIALFETQEVQEKERLLNLAKIEVNKSIEIYENWQINFGDLSELQIKSLIKPIYNTRHPLFENDKKESYINKRTNNVVLAQKETPRRLSVSYTNLGIILRHQNQIEEALKMYNKALDLWGNNLTAENNINIIMGEPIKERSVLEKMFPDKK